MSAPSPKIEELYAKLHSKYTKLKKEHDTEMEKLNAEQEAKFMNYVAAATNCIEYEKSENASLRQQVEELRSSKDEEKIQHQKLLMEEHLKNKELLDEIQRLQQLVRQETSSHPSSDKRESLETIAVGDSLPLSVGSAVKATKKRRRQSLPSEELRTGSAQPNMSPSSRTEPAFSGGNVDISGHGAANSCPGTCIFQDLVQLMVGFKISSVMEKEELCISALHESSGFSFKLRRIKSESEEGELEYISLSVGNLERVAPKWMRGVIRFSPKMCLLFFETISRVLPLRH